MSDDFTGMKLEPHDVLPGEQVCVCYVDGERMAVLYFKPHIRTVRLVVEGKIRPEVLRRPGGPGTVDFEELL